METKKIRLGLIVLYCLATFFISAPANAAVSYERVINSIVNKMTQSDPGDVVILPEETKVKIRGLIEDTRAGKLQLDCIEAFNNYNFCQLANNILGDLYKSHGCLHVSPINVRVLNEVLPIGSEMVIKPYDADFDTEKAKSVPSLISLIDFKTDLANVKSDLSSKTDVRTIVYPGKGAYVIFLKGEPYAVLKVSGGTKDKMYMFQYRDEQGFPVFDDSLASPTPAGKLYVFKKVVNYVSNIYRNETTIPMGSLIKKLDGKWMFKISETQWQKAPAAVAEDIALPDKDRQYVYFAILKDTQGNITQARWASNTFGSYPILLSRNMKSQAPELIHTTCDLIVDQYLTLFNMVDVLSKPYASFEQCAAAAKSISDNKACFDFDQNPAVGGIEKAQSAYYKLYFDLPLLPEEAAALPKDAIIANKIVKKQGPLDASEENLLISEGIAAKKGGQTVIDMKKILGLQFYTYQNVVMIKKYANLYSSLRDNWNDLSTLRSTIVSDMRKLSIMDPVLYRRFAVGLILKRIGLKKLTQDDVLDELSDTLGL